MKYAPGFMLLVASWLQPMHVLPWTSWHSEVLALAGLAWFVAVQVYGKRFNEQASLAVPKAALLPLALGVYALLQFSLGKITYFGDALMIALYLAVCALALTLGHQWGADSAAVKPGIPDALSSLAVTVLAGALLSVCIMLTQALDVWREVEWISRAAWYRRPGGNLGQPNHMATLILMGAASLFWLQHRHHLDRGLAILLLTLLILGLAMTESRAGLLSAVFLTIWWLMRGGVLGIGPRRRGLIFAWTGLALLVWIWPVFITAWHQAGAEAVSRIQPGFGERGVVWVQLLEAAMDRPWAGWGLGEVSEAHNTVLHQYAQGAPYTYAHNLILDLAIGMGFPLTLLLVMVTGHWIWRRIQRARTPQSWYCLALCLPFAAHSMLEFPHAYAYFLIPVLLALGFMEGNSARQCVFKLRGRYAGAGVSVLFLLLSWSAIEYLAIEEDFRVARFEALRVGKTMDEYKAPDTILLTQLDGMLKATRITPSPGMSVNQLELLREAASRFPWTAIQNRYALSLALNGNGSEAMRQLKVIRAMHGEQHYDAIKANWLLIASEKYPELKQLKLP